MGSSQNNLDNLNDIYADLEDLEGFSLVSKFDLLYEISTIGLVRSLALISSSNTVKDLETSITSNLFKINKAINDILKKDKIKKVRYKYCDKNEKLLNEYIDNNFRDFKLIFTTPDELIKREIKNHIDIAYHINCIRSWINSLTMFNVTLSKNDSEDKVVFKILKKCNAQLLSMENKLAALYFFQNKKV